MAEAELGGWSMMTRFSVNRFSALALFAVPKCSALSATLWGLQATTWRLMKPNDK